MFLPLLINTNASIALAVVVNVGAVAELHLNTAFQVGIRLPVPS